MSRSDTGPGTFAGTFEASGAISDTGTTEDILDVSSPEGEPDGGYLPPDGHRGEGDVHPRG